MSEKKEQELEGWQPYDLDYYAQQLILKHRDKEDVLNETHKMRMTVAYGLERFWGEHLRLKREKKNRNKSMYWKDVWDELVKILKKAGVNLPEGNIVSDKSNGKTETQQIREVANQLWNMNMNDQRIALMVLTQLSDSLVWWKQRYGKKSKDS